MGLMTAVRLVGCSVVMKDWRLVVKMVAWLEW